MAEEEPTEPPPPGETGRELGRGEALARIIARYSITRNQNQERPMAKRPSKRATTPASEKPTTTYGRAALLVALANMPDEAFGWFVLWASGSTVQFPDGLGGFRAESRASITALRSAAAAYLEKAG